jgi:hypothetical protein
MEVEDDEEYSKDSKEEGEADLREELFSALEELGK